ncbi:hypothetical protein JCM16303_005084 [Sporobolomyces ruberrimus]
MFRKMYPGAYAQNLRWAKKLGIPGWNGLESYASSVRAHDIFASNLTITYDSFSNVPHKDNDKDVFVTSGCWVNLYFNKLLRPDQEWPLIGGNFHLFEYSLMIDFSRNRGLTWLTWVGTRDYHMTSEIQNPTGAKGYDRLGSSLQHKTGGRERKADEEGKEGEQIGNLRL